MPFQVSTVIFRKPRQMRLPISSFGDLRFAQARLHASDLKALTQFSFQSITHSLFLWLLGCTMHRGRVEKIYSCSSCTALDRPEHHGACIAKPHDTPCIILDSIRVAQSSCSGLHCHLALIASSQMTTQTAFTCSGFCVHSFSYLMLAIL